MPESRPPVKPAGRDGLGLRAWLGLSPDREADRRLPKERLRQWRARRSRSARPAVRPSGQTARKVARPWSPLRRWRWCGEAALVDFLTRPARKTQLRQLRFHLLASHGPLTARTCSWLAETACSSARNSALR